MSWGKRHVPARTTYLATLKQQFDAYCAEAGTPVMGLIAFHQFCADTEATASGRAE